MTEDRANQKTIIIDTGANIEALATTFAGQLAFPTSNGASLIAERLYQRNAANNAWAAVVTTFNNLYTVFRAETVLAKQRFVEWFSGNDIDTGRWTKRNSTGTGTFGSVDAADEGCFVSCGATSGDGSFIDFNDKRHFVHNASEIITVFRRVDASSNAFAGFRRAISSVTNEATAQDITTATFKRLVTADATTQSTSDSDVAIDTSWHVYRVVCGSADIKLYIDGVLKVTKTTNRPTQAMQPEFFVSSTAAGAKSIRFRYCEAYNT